MSRVGRLPIPLGGAVQVTVEGNRVTVKGPRGELSRELPPEVRLHIEGDQVRVARDGDRPRQRAMHGLARTLVANMVAGVQDGFSKSLELQGVGYRAQKQGRALLLTVGYSHPVQVEPPAGIEFEVESPTLLHVRGIDKELVGQVAASVRKVRPPEPYKGKGVRYRGEYVRRKAGKGARKGGP